MNVVVRNSFVFVFVFVFVFLSYFYRMIKIYSCSNPEFIP